MCDIFLRQRMSNIVWMLAEKFTYKSFFTEKKMYPEENTTIRALLLRNGILKSSRRLGFYNKVDVWHISATNFVKMNVDR